MLMKYKQMIENRVISTKTAGIDIETDESIVGFFVETFFDGLNTGEKQYIYHYLLAKVIKVPIEEGSVSDSENAA